MMSSNVSGTASGDGRFIMLHRLDDVVIAAADLEPGSYDVAGLGRIVLPARVVQGHKVAVRKIAVGEPVRKYGSVIGFATAVIEAGGHVHSHNLAFDAARYSPDGDVAAAEATDVVVPVLGAPATFNGYVRADGRVGTRNYLAVVTTVNCSATPARLIAERLRMSGVLAEFPAVDGVVTLTHSSGCGLALGSEGFATLRRTLAGYAAHPNISGLLVLGLGCEVNQIAALTAEFELPADTLLQQMTIQEIGGTTRTVVEGVARLRDMLPDVARARRQTVSASELVLALNCGGSDGYSGITANPALGAAADMLVAAGGTAVLAETPEIFGAEQLLARRAVSSDVAKRLLDVIDWWQRYAAAEGGSLDNNPSPGNKAGGLTTILEKSLGAVAKGGTSPLVDVVRYADPVRAKGLVFMDTPGYDPVSVTGLVAGGANIVCFTTGRGSVFGCKPAPSLKLATNSEMYARMADDMDVNCGLIADGEYTVQEMGGQIFDLMLQTASGRQTKSEQLGFGDEEFAPWQLGVTM